jgi:phosphate starvation-inducible PhoH-like protein
MKPGQNKHSSSKRLSLKSPDEALFVIGEQDRRLRDIEGRLGVRVFYEQDKETGEFTLNIKGNASNVNRAFNELLDLKKRYVAVAPALLRRTAFPEFQGAPAGQICRAAQEAPRAGEEKVIYTSYSGKKVIPLSPHQEVYINAIKTHDLVIGIGPAGTGKTFLAVACALSMLDAGKVERIVLTRPVVEAGEKLGFLPGDLYEKVSPYLKPLYDSFHFMLGSEKFRKYRDEEIIEIVPLAYMRGRTLEDAFIILDEAQNTLLEQMKMFLTRLGLNSQAVVTGDITQIDLEHKTISGLVTSEQILSEIKDIAFINFSEEDVVRHRLVREIIRAYEKWERRNA